MISHITYTMSGKIKLPIKCNLCDKEYASTSSLNRHIKEKHSDQKRFVCIQCKKEFSETAALDSHVMSRHIHKVTKNLGLYACIECNKNFSTQLDLARHMKMHISEKKSNEQCIKVMQSSSKHMPLGSTDSKTVQKQEKQKCHQCHKMFVRLDKHIKCSAKLFESSSSSLMIHNTGESNMLLSELDDSKCI